MKKKIIGRLLWIIVGMFLTLAVQEVSTKYKTQKKAKKMLSLLISSVDREISKLHLLNMNTTLYDYKAKDTLLLHIKPMEMKLKENYNRLLKDPDIITQMDISFHVNIEAFKDEQTRLSNWYNQQSNDFSRDLIKDEIENQLLFEKEILTAELDYLENEIGKDSLTDVRENAFRKYISYTLVFN